MKKVLFFLSTALLLMCQTGITPLKAQASVTIPIPDQEYNIVQATGLFLTRNLSAENPVVQNPSGNYDQIFVFEPVPDEDNTYYIKNTYDDDYLVRLSATNGWTMGWVKDPAAIVTDGKADDLNDGKYQIMVLEDTEDYIQIKNLGSASMIGSDDPTDGATVYGNKSGLTDVKYQWKIKEYSDEVDKTALQNKLDEATTLYDATVEGTGSDQYPTDTRTALNGAITLAQELINDSGAEQGDINGALQDLGDALDAYKASVNPYLPDESKTFYIIHSSELYFTNGGTIDEGDYTANQHFTFEAVAGKTAIYNIKSVGTGQYMTREVGPEGEEFTYWWGISWADDATQYSEFEIKSTGTGFYTIKCTGEVLNEGVQRSSCLGTDANETGTGVFLDKNGKDGKHFWKFQDINDMPVVKTALEAALTEVSEFLTYAVKGEGSDQYPAAEYDALTAAQSTANTVIDDNDATQTQVSDATLALDDALSACIAAVNPFSPDLSITYNIIHYSGLYFGANSDTTSAIFANMETDDQYFQFVAVAGNDSAFNIKNVSLNKYLTRASDSTGVTDGVTQYNDYDLFWGDDASTDFAKFTMKRVGNENYRTIMCITAGPQRTTSYVGTDDVEEADTVGVFVDKNGTSTNHYWNIVDKTSAAITNVVYDGEKPVVYSGNSMLNITNLNGVNLIKVYSLSGQLVSYYQTTEPIYSKNLETGIYIAVVQGDSNYNGIVVVK